MLSEMDGSKVVKCSPFKAILEFPTLPSAAFCHVEVACSLSVQKSSEKLTSRHAFRFWFVSLSFKRRK